MDDLENAVKSLSKAHSNIKEVLDYQKEEHPDDEKLEALLAQVVGNISSANISTKKAYAEQNGREALHKLDEEIEENDTSSRSED